MGTMATRTVGTRITEADHARLREVAAALGTTPASVLREALALYVEIALPLALLARRGGETQGGRRGPKNTSTRSRAPGRS